MNKINIIKTSSTCHQKKVADEEKMIKLKMMMRLMNI